MKEDILTYDELLKFNDEMIKDIKEFDKELRTHINKQEIIIVGEPTFDSSEFEKVFQSAREEGCGIAMILPSDDRGIDIEHVPNENIFFGISRSSFEPMIYQDELAYQLDEEYEEKQEYKEFEINKLIKPPKKKKTFQENFGYVKRKFR